MCVFFVVYILEYKCMYTSSRSLARKIHKTENPNARQPRSDVQYITSYMLIRGARVLAAIVARTRSARSVRAQAGEMRARAP